MITGKDIYDVLAAIVPLYVAMILAYGSVRWWKIFTPEQCSGVNRFVAVFAVPLLSFHFISTNNPYKMNYLFIAADSLQKILILAALFLFQSLSKSSSLDWSITLFSLSTLPNTLVMGIPLLKAMYGDFSGTLMVQIVVLQSVIWYTLMLFLLEYRGAKLLIAEQFPEGLAGSITSFKVENDVVSLNGREPLQAETQIGEDGRLHVVVKKSSSSLGPLTPTPRDSNLTGVEIYSVQSSMEPTPRASNLAGVDMYVWSSTASPSSPTQEGKITIAGVLEEGAEPLQSLKANQKMPPASVMTRLILIMVWRKLIRNPNTYSSLFGLVWSVVSFRFSIEMPSIVKGSIAILSDAGLGMAMFSLGLFMALQPKIIACGKSLAGVSMAVRFLAGPAVIAATSISIGLRGTLLHIAIVQAALPQGIVPFVFAKEYNLHPDILSTAVIFGMLIALPITILYYVLLGL